MYTLIGVCLDVPQNSCVGRLVPRLAELGDSMEFLEDRASWDVSWSVEDMPSKGIRAFLVGQSLVLRI